MTGRHFDDNTQSFAEVSPCELSDHDDMDSIDIRVSLVMQDAVTAIERLGELIKEITGGQITKPSGISYNNGHEASVL